MNLSPSMRLSLPADESPADAAPDWYTDFADRISDATAADFAAAGADVTDEDIDESVAASKFLAHIGAPDNNVLNGITAKRFLSLAGVTQ